MPSISVAYQWAIARCNAPNVGYSRDHREEETIDGITYYDCSSFIWYALKAGGFPLTPPPFTTSTMIPILQSLGFTSVPITGQWVAGDIVWRSGHCEMVYSGGVGQGVTMGAHSANLPLEDQVSINDHVSTSANFTYLFRYGGGVPTREWIRDPTEYKYFDTAEQQNNALCLRDWFLTNSDWSLQAIAGLAGNVQQESGFNPDLIEHGGTGHGLVQWTPPTDLYVVLDYLYGNHDDWGDPVKQLSVIMAEYGKAIGTIPPVTDPDFEKQWYETSSYPISWLDWSHSTQDPGYLAMAFEYNYERPAAHHPERAEYARQWYQYFLDNPYSPPGPTRMSKLAIWQMIRYHL